MDIDDECDDEGEPTPKGFTFPAVAQCAHQVLEMSESVTVAVLAADALKGAAN
jgi:hypothetical protein